MCLFFLSSKHCHSQDIFFKNLSAAPVKKDIPGHFQSPGQAQECCATGEELSVLDIQSQRLKAMSLLPQSTKQNNKTHSLDP